MALPTNMAQYTRIHIWYAFANWLLGPGNLTTKTIIVSIFQDALGTSSLATKLGWTDSRLT